MTTTVSTADEVKKFGNGSASPQIKDLIAAISTTPRDGSSLATAVRHAAALQEKHP
ncbi:hypothetical protein [Phyllobacterium lublinensis]|uniref:hypothetical protein n=1 Tax=Phyllobacterium lublinensis TaxID=2875708 RepID=UPI001CCB83CE|nr:hypothetical protein [Phyllobacterium sp. 2063]MBZ9654676.1 hypothetical protein [Phyllobacterium sp. 2063]